MTKSVYIAETICDGLQEAVGHGSSPERALLTMLQNAIGHDINTTGRCLPTDYLQECADIMRELEEEGFDEPDQKWICGDFSADLYRIRIALIPPAFPTTP